MAFFDFLHIFTDLFNAAKRAWNKVEPEVQAALIHGSGVIDIINRNLTAIPADVVTLIQTKFPDLDVVKLQIGLQAVTTQLTKIQAVPDQDLATTIQNLQTYLSGLQGNFWEGASSTLAQLLSIVLAPQETIFAKVVSLTEYVYRTFIRKS